jgi:hypothetical protein
MLRGRLDALLCRSIQWLYSPLTLLRDRWRVLCGLEHRQTIGLLNYLDPCTVVRDSYPFYLVCPVTFSFNSQKTPDNVVLLVEICGCLHEIPLLCL